jgi:SOS response regulatory protein OraA/RecX
MSLFHNILSQIQEKISKESIQHETVARILSDTLHTAITADQLTFKNGVLNIKVPPTLKMAINMQKQKILQALQAEGFSITTIQ